MRHAVVLLVFSALTATAASAESVAGPVSVQRLPWDARLALETPAPAGAAVGLRLLTLAELEAVEAVAEQTVAAAVGVEEAPSLRRVPSFQEDTRVFWYATGAAAITSLATRVLLAVPGFFVLGLTLAAGAILPPIASWVLIIGAVVAWAVIDAALSAFASSFVYDRVSRFYESSFIPGFAGQLTGAALAGGVLTMTIGFGVMLTSGLEFITPFTLQGALQTVQLFSALGVMPAMVIAFLASVALPAIMGTWALAATAGPKEGYVIDRTWRPLDKRRDLALLPEGRDRPKVPVAVTLALPGS